MTALARAADMTVLDHTPDLRTQYLECLNLVERLHRQLLDVIKDELDRRGERIVNSVQALLLFNIGDQELTAGELRTRGHYLGSNVSYNLKKLVEAGYLHHQRSETDRRSVHVKLTAKGREIRDTVRKLFHRHLESLEAVGNVATGDLETLNISLRRLERFWLDQVRYRL
jgi:DNA-binding MarR family transcriptional regulator